MLFANDDRALAIVSGRRVLLDGRDVTSDCTALCVCPDRSAVELLERPLRVDGDEIARRLVYGKVELR
jgi:hypothetical protein